MTRHFSLADRLIIGLDNALLTSFGQPTASRPNPAAAITRPHKDTASSSRSHSHGDATNGDAAKSVSTIVSESAIASSPSSTLTANEKQLSASLMRVNHAGEIAAQALYKGQALTARTDQTRHSMAHAAEEEIDHLAWCAERLTQLDSHTSRLAPFWYGGSFALGAFAGLLGDRTSLGFVAETEKQVAAHLAKHLEQLPENDYSSRAIVAEMQADEERHGAEAMAAGGKELPEPVQSLMRHSAKVMTTLAHHI